MILHGCISAFIDWENAKLVMLHFLLFPLCIFHHCIHGYCAQFLACLLECFFAFWLCMYIRLFALFFPIVLLIPSFISAIKMFTFAILLFCRFLTVPLPRSEWLLVYAFCFFLRSTLNMIIYFGGDNLFCLFAACFTDCFVSFRVLFFLLKKAQVACFLLDCIDSFCFSFSESVQDIFGEYICLAQTPPAVLLLCPNILLDTRFLRCRFPPSFFPWPSIAKHVLLAYLWTFLPCFRFHDWLCIYADPSEPIYTHSHPSLIIFDCNHKTWCSGKFPRP